MNNSINFLCDLWIVLSQLSNHQNIGENDCNAIVEVMQLVVEVLILKLQNEVPNILAILTDFGASELSHRMDSVLRAYEPNVENPVVKAA
ncbi:hypothetical protein [Bartonella gliris]|uniref:hypothetical protein n=1 Tax=Bartonella gliris TaxID=3004109 RepID=UPI0038737519